MSILSQSNNHYWDNGAFCVNCGILTGNVTNNGIHPIWHAGCKPGCNSTWEDQEPIMSDDEYAQVIDEERDMENKRRNALCKTPADRTDEFELWANEYGLIKTLDEEFALEVNERQEMSLEDINVLEFAAKIQADVDWETLEREESSYVAEWRHPYHEDDEELEREAREEDRRQMEAQEREEQAMEERDRRECQNGYDYDEDYDDDDMIEY